MCKFLQKLIPRPPSFLSQGASCIDASSAFSGLLSITNTSFTDNWQPVAVKCSGSSNTSSSVDASSGSCAVTMADTHFSSNSGNEALSVRLDCGASSSCTVTLAGCAFTQHAIQEGSRFKDTAAVLLVSALQQQTALKVSLDSCQFFLNAGAGMAVNSLSGSVVISNSSFVGHQGVASGLPALSITGAASVVLNGSLWDNNSLGAIALSQVQSSVLLKNSKIIDNIYNPTTLSSVDILMTDLVSSSVSVFSCFFANNSGETVQPAILGAGKGEVLCTSVVGVLLDH